MSETIVVQAAEEFLQVVGNHCLKQGEDFAWHMAMHTGIEATALREALDAFYQKERDYERTIVNRYRPTSDPLPLL